MKISRRILTLLAAGCLAGGCGTNAERAETPAPAAVSVTPPIPATPPAPAPKPADPVAKKAPEPTTPPTPEQPVDPPEEVARRWYASRRTCLVVLVIGELQDPSRRCPWLASSGRR